MAGDRRASRAVSSGPAPVEQQHPPAARRPASAAASASPRSSMFGGLISDGTNSTGGPLAAIIAQRSRRATSAIAGIGGGGGGPRRLLIAAQAREARASSAPDLLRFRCAAWRGTEAAGAACVAVRQALVLGPIASACKEIVHGGVRGPTTMWSSSRNMRTGASTIPKAQPTSRSSGSPRWSARSASSRWSTPRAARTSPARCSTQIIMEEESRGATMLPVNFLRQLISMYGDRCSRWCRNISRRRSRRCSATRASSATPWPAPSPPTPSPRSRAATWRCSPPPPPAGPPAARPRSPRRRRHQGRARRPQGAARRAPEEARQAGLIPPASCARREELFGLHEPQGHPVALADGEIALAVLVAEAQRAAAASRRRSASRRCRADWR